MNIFSDIEETLKCCLVEHIITNSQSQRQGIFIVCFVGIQILPEMFQIQIAQIQILPMVKLIDVPLYICFQFQWYNR